MKWMQLKARPLQLLRTRQRVAWGDTNYLQYKFYFTLSFNCLDDLIQLNCHSFVRKFKVCVFMDCFHWDLDNIRSFFSDFFSVSAAVVKRTAAKRFTALILHDLGALLYLLTTEICEISLVCLYITISMAPRSREELFVTGKWLPWTEAM